jgi:pilus assembly protein CpaE
MIKIVIGAADQTIAYGLRAAVTEMEGIDALFVVESTTELVAAVLRLDPDVVLVHDQLGPDQVLHTVRDLALRRATCAALVVTLSPTADQFGAAMDAGARGLIAYPPSFENLQDRVLAAGEWAQTMRRMLSTSAANGEQQGAGRGRVITFVGAKGGVGTTTVATHSALDVVRTVPGHKVCLLDLDLEKGDVAGILEVRHRASIADVAKVSEDLSAQAVADAVVVHESGLHLLLSPADIRDVEAVDPRSLREVLAVLRQEYDLVVIDGGSHVTPAQATVVELSDEVVALTTPDVLALRALRRAITHWENLGVRKESDLHVLLNRVSKQTTVSADTVRQLTRAPVISVGLPSMFRRLEVALNSRDPLSLREELWWRSLRAIGQEITLLGPKESSTTPAPESRGRSMRKVKGARRDAGQAALETVGMFPLLVVLCFTVWQIAVAGMTLVWSGHAANAAARAASISDDPEVVQSAARDAVPDGMREDLTVITEISPQTRQLEVTVSLKVPIAAPGVGAFPTAITTTRTIAPEPR